MGTTSGSVNSIRLVRGEHNFLIIARLNCSHPVSIIELTVTINAIFSDMKTSYHEEIGFIIGKDECRGMESTRGRDVLALVSTRNAMNPLLVPNRVNMRCIGGGKIIVVATF